LGRLSPASAYSGGYSVSESFTLAATATVGQIVFGAWVNTGDSITGVTWSIGTAPFGTSSGSGVAAATSSYDSSNADGYDVHIATFAVPGVTLAAGTYYLTLSSAASTAGGPVYWDINDASSVDGWSSSYGHVSVSNPSAQTNFPALISGTFGDFATTASGGRISNTCTQTVGNNATAVPCDLIFTSDAAGTALLNWEFETWTSATWSNNFMAVYHLKENPAGTAPQMNDSTANANHATMNGPALASQQQPGEIDGSVNFEGNTWASLANPANFSFERTDSFSLSGWFKLASNSVGALISKFPAVPNAGWALEQYSGVSTPVFALGLFGSGASTSALAETPAVTMGVWHYVVATYSGTGTVAGYPPIPWMRFGSRRKAWCFRRPL
jgi:hypothetical protein